MKKGRRRRKGRCRRRDPGGELALLLPPFTDDARRAGREPVPCFRCGADLLLGDTEAVNAALDFVRVARFCNSAYCAGCVIALGWLHPDTDPDDPCHQESLARFLSEVQEAGLLSPEAARLLRRAAAVRPTVVAKVWVTDPDADAAPGRGSPRYQGLFRWLVRRRDGGG
jgi:hypothetical protein